MLCHERDYNGVYRRLFAQGTYLSTKANELREAQKQGLPCADDPAKVQADAEMFLLAADRVVREYPDKIDEDAVRESLLKQTGDNCERLKPGYDDFVVVLDRLGCLQCHSTQAKVGDKLDPACYGAFVLDCNAYNKSVNVRALSQHIDFDNVAQSQLLAKAANRVDHEGAARVKLDQSQLDELSGALAKWLRAYSNGVSPRSDGNSPVSAVPVAAASLVQRTAPQERPAAPQP
ncbi:MAG: hypothetical protein IT427_15975 [Pirellulales bacterium]|nr:hypothetical protein [Pirellulales bacterium]